MTAPPAVICNARAVNQAFILALPTSTALTVSVATIAATPARLMVAATLTASAAMEPAIPPLARLMVTVQRIVVTVEMVSAKQVRTA